MPARAIGLAWAGVDPAERDLDVVDRRAGRDAPAPGRWTSALTLANLPPDSEAYVTLAAVDLGILNLTRYETPDPEAYYFGQRRLGVVDPRPLQPADRPHAGRARRGALRRRRRPRPLRRARRRRRRWSPSIPASSRSARTARRTISVPVPDFNGTLRLMAMAWTRDGVGHAEKDVLVRDPVVVTASLPHFLAPGDQSRLALDLASVADVAGDGRRSRCIRPATAVSVDPAFAERAGRARRRRAEADPRADLRRDGRRRRAHRRADASRRRGAGEAR